MSLFCSCSAFTKNNIPYLIDAEMVMEDSPDYEVAGLNFDFFNKENKTVSKITMVFYLYDSDGNPVSFGKSNIVVSVGVTVEPGERIQGCISLDGFLFEYPEEVYQVDYLYLSQIVYEDGSSWSDPFGLLAF